MRLTYPLILVPFLLAGCGSSSDSGGGTPEPPEPVVDSDNDGVPDIDDMFPYDPTETTDIDRDGIGDNADTKLARYDKPSSYDEVATSISDLKTKISNASSGDVIALQDGIYSDVDLDISKDGVIVVAETSGQVFIEGQSTVELSGDDIIFEGFVFQNGYPRDSKGAIIISGSDNRVTNCKIDHFDISGNDYKWVSFDNDAKRGEVDHCHFTGKETEGALLVVWRDDTTEQHHHIYRNIFSDHQYKESNDINGDNNGWEAIRIGTSNQSQSDSSTIVEANYFYDNNGEIEIISNKSGNNIYRYNTFESSSGLLTLRHGTNCTVDSNYFLIDNTSGGGIRVIDSGHTITNNYIEGAQSTSNSRGGIALSSSQDNPELSGYWEVEDVTVANNTIIDSKQSLHYGSSAKDNPPASADITNNLIKTNQDFVRVTDGLNITNPYYADNYFWGGGSLGFSPVPDGINFSEVELTVNGNGQHYATDDSLDLGAPRIVKLSFTDVQMGTSYEEF